MDKNKKIIIAVICVIVIAVAVILILNGNKAKSFEDLLKNAKTVEDFTKLKETADKELKEATDKLAAATEDKDGALAKAVEAAQKKLADLEAAMKTALPEEVTKLFPAPAEETPAEETPAEETPAETPTTVEAPAA